LVGKAMPDAIAPLFWADGQVSADHPQHRPLFHHRHSRDIMVLQFVYDFRNTITRGGDDDLTGQDLSSMSSKPLYVKGMHYGTRG
jgi:hypothetical protein